MITLSLYRVLAQVVFSIKKFSYCMMCIHRTYFNLYIEKQLGPEHVRNSPGKFKR